MAILVLAAAGAFSAAAFAHHSQAMFDTTKEVLIEGKVARFDWKNPHMYLVVETKGPDGKPELVEGEGLAITQALVDGLRREALMPGTPVVMRANPVAPDRAARRSAVLRRAVARGYREFAARALGRERSAVILRRRNPSGTLIALTDNFLRVRVEGPDSVIGRRARVQALETSPDGTLLGCLVE
jgi:hypothetical protein